MNSTPSWKNWPSGIMLLLFVAPFIAHAQSPVRFQQIDLVPEVGGSVEVVGTDGNVRSAGAFYQPSSAEDEEAPATSLTVAPGETIRTQKHAAIANLQGNGNMRLAPNSQVQLPKADAPAQASLSLKAGRVMLNIALDPSQGEQKVIINGQVMSVGTKEGKLFVETREDGGEVVGVHEGKAAVTKDGRTAEVRSGKTLKIDASGDASLRSMSSGEREFGEDYPEDRLKWEEAGSIDWDDWGWTIQAHYRDPINDKDVTGNPGRWEIDDFRHERWGKGRELSFETKRKFEAIHLQAKEVDTSRIRNIPLAVELWINTEPLDKVKLISKAWHPHESETLLKKPFWSQIENWTRVTLPLESFAPDGQERRLGWLQFTLEHIPANTEGFIRVVPSRILSLKN